MAVAGQTCENCKHVVIYADQTVHCHCEVPPWRAVDLDDWCGRWEASAAGLVNQYVRGQALLQTATPVPLMKLPVPLMVGAAFNTVIIAGCQVVNSTTREDCVVTMLDGNDINKPLGFIGCPAHDARDFSFHPGLMASKDNEVYAALNLDITPDHVYVTAQGFVVIGG